MKNVLTAAGLLLAVPASGQERKIEWMTDYQAALKEAKRTGKKVVIIFTYDT